MPTGVQKKRVERRFRGHLSEEYTAPADAGAVRGPEHVCPCGRGPCEGCVGGGGRYRLVAGRRQGAGGRAFCCPDVSSPVASAGWKTRFAGRSRRISYGNTFRAKRSRHQPTGRPRVFGQFGQIRKGVYGRKGLQGAEPPSWIGLGGTPPSHKKAAARDRAAAFIGYGCKATLHP